MQYSPIGVFDSGYGGLTVLKELHRALPEYDYLYFGDNARAPYGTRSFDIVYEYTLECVEQLFKEGCQLVILACNTASAKALRTIQQNDLAKYPGKRVLGVIRPSAEIVGVYSKSNHIGILATEGTVKSNSYPLEISKFYPKLKVSQQACPMWVPLVENGEYHSEEGKGFIQRDIERFINTYKEIDTIVLGCTHYPLLIPVIKEFIPSNIQLLSQGEIVANALSDYLERHSWMNEKLSKNGETNYLTSENPTIFDEKVMEILDIKIQSKQINIEHK